MPKTKKITKYFTAKIPNSMAKTIQKYIDENPEIFRYRSPNEFINEATRIHLNYYEDKILQDKGLKNHHKIIDKKYLKK